MQLADKVKARTIQSSFVRFKVAWLILLISACIILALGQFTDIDLMIEDYYYDSALKVFPWRDSWFASDFMHGYLKNIIINGGYILYLIVLIDLFKPWQKVNPFFRLRLRFIALASILIPLVVRTIKQLSVLHCPSNIDRYGGEAPFLRLLDYVPTDIKVGQCFPAAHATVGLWLAALCVFWLPHHPKRAVRIFFAGLSVGLIMGWVQQMRGQHFLFHTLWSAWLASLIILIMLQTTYTFLEKEKQGDKNEQLSALS